jgi:hypothetical protein
LVFKQVAKALRPGGVFYISLKENDDYLEEIKSDAHGDRMFYFYNPVLIKDIAGGSFSSVYEDHQERSKKWFTIALRRNSI